MKIAILANIESNVYALQEVLLDATNQKVDAILNLGDSLYGSIEPRKTYDLLRESSFINICGDKDRKILEASLEQLESDNELKNIYENLGEDVLYWIQSLPFEKLIGEDFYMIHGSYFNDSECLLEDENGNLRDDSKIVDLLDDIKSKFIFCSNSSIPRCINLSTGQIVINPGSVNDDVANYIILDIEDSEFKLELRKIEY